MNEQQVVEKKQTLFQIDDQLRQLLEIAFDPETGELLAEYEEELDELTGGKSQKLDSYLYVIKNATNLVTRCKAEITRLQKIIKREENSISGMMIRVEMVLYKGEKYESNAGTFGWQKSSTLETAVDFDINAFYNTPGTARFCSRTTPDPVLTLDKAKCKEYLKADEKHLIPGVFIKNHNKLKVK